MKARPQRADSWPRHVALGDVSLYLDSSMTWENLTADADALRQHLGFGKWAVLGHSFGGHVALEYALRYPDRVSRLGQLPVQPASGLLD